MDDKVDYTAMDGPTLLHTCGQDASKWAAAFCQYYPSALSQVEGREGVVQGEDFESIMLGWFANAIMHTLDTERGTIINGEHAQYLLDNGRTPDGG